MGVVSLPAPDYTLLGPPLLIISEAILIRFNGLDDHLKIISKSAVNH
jgi:hypothetical protein